MSHALSSALEILPSLFLSTWAIAPKDKMDKATAVANNFINTPDVIDQ